MNKCLWNSATDCPRLESSSKAELGSGNLDVAIAQAVLYTPREGTVARRSHTGHNNLERIRVFISGVQFCFTFFDGFLRIGYVKPVCCGLALKLKLS